MLNVSFYASLSFGFGSLLSRVGGPTQGHSGSRCIVVDPEGDPGEDGNQDGRHVCLQDEVTDVPLQFEAEGQTGVGTCRRQRGNT